MKLLLAVDGSPHSEPPVSAVLARPWPAGTQVRVLSVVESHQSPGFAATSLMAPEAYAQAQHMLQSEADALVHGVAQRLRATGLIVETLVSHGSTGHEIVEQARKWPADLILMGSRGRSGLKRIVLGSVATYVVAHAPCSVEVARSPNTAHASQ